MKALYALIPILFSIFSIIYIKGDSKPEIRELPASSRPGYETVGAEYDITVSPQYRWSHGGHNLAFIVVGFALFVLSGLYINKIQHFGKNGLFFTLIFWALGLIAIFGKYSFTYYNDRYSKRFTQVQYEANKNDLHKLFEE